ncbi:MAG: ribonuclease E inhibitor RraB, partial [Acidimicrobiales bacterium]|nr:ribonuclease E inhibitor RraB [Acidimicrobiales bacterium]
KQLIDHGADLTAPRHVLHYLYFSDEQSAQMAAAEVAAPFSAEVRSPSEGVTEWLVLCEAHDHMLNPETVRGDTDFFESLAERHGGDHDGWEASV